MSLRKNNAPFYIPWAHYPKAPDWEMHLRIIWGRGIFQRKNFERLMEYADRRDVALDIGSHVGSWAIPMAQAFKRVVAFEPEPRNLRFLRQNVARAQKDNISISRYALVGPDQLKQAFYLQSGRTTRNSGMAHLKKTKTPSQHNTQPKCITLDKILGTYVPVTSDVNLIKIDVEGMELKVLQGSVKTIKTHLPVIQVEINRLTGRYDTSAEKLYEFFDSLGYDPATKTKSDHIFIPR